MTTACLAMAAMEYPPWQQQQQQQATHICAAPTHVPPAAAAAAGAAAAAAAVPCIVTTAAAIRGDACLLGDALSPFPGRSRRLCIQSLCWHVFCNNPVAHEINQTTNDLDT